MVAITLITRGFFFLPRAQLPMPAWLNEGLRYAPLAAMVAVVAPEIVMTQGAPHHHLEGRPPVRRRGGHRLVLLAA